MASSRASKSSAGGAAVLDGGLAAGLFDEDLAHGPGGGPEELPPPFPAGVLVPHQAQVRLVDEGRRLQGLSRPQLARQRPGQAAQLGVNVRPQGRSGLFFDRGVFGARWFRHRATSCGAKGTEKSVEILTLAPRHSQMIRQGRQALFPAARHPEECPTCPF
jgi:hypothetical protein